MSPQFSPSKAQAQQAQAKAWSSVDAWLSRRYSEKPPPTFERNEETLEILLTLATLNESADEQRGQIDRIEKTTLSAHSKRLAKADKSFHTILSGMNDHEALNALSEALVYLNCPDIGTSTMATAISDLTARNFEAEQQVRLLESQVEILRTKKTQTIGCLDDTMPDRFQVPSDLAHDTADWIRSAKHMRAKIAEYDDRLVGVQSTEAPQSRFNSITPELQALNAQMERVGQLQAEMSAYQSLPSNGKAARAWLESARADLLSSTQRRDELFEALADSR